jgi:nitric oxide reductase subunit B
LIQPVLCFHWQIFGRSGVFQKYGLMDVGSFFGHGACQRPDFSADYLHRQGEIALQQLAQKRFHALRRA